MKQIPQPACNERGTIIISEDGELKSVGDAHHVPGVRGRGGLFFYACNLSVTLLQMSVLVVIAITTVLLFPSISVRLVSSLSYRMRAAHTILYRGATAARHLRAP